MASERVAHRVLVIEDDFLLASSLTDLLEDAGFVVLGPVARLKEALRAACDLAADIALLDVNLAGERVFPAAEVLDRRGIPFIFLTGYGSHVLPVQFRSRPLICKPFSPGLLLQALAKILAPVT